MTVYGDDKAGGEITLEVEELEEVIAPASGSNGTLLVGGGG
jgi:hypothetical protein